MPRGLKQSPDIEGEVLAAIIATPPGSPGAGTSRVKTPSLPLMGRRGGVFVHCAVAATMDLLALAHSGQLPWLHR
jgi:hypothetical protein